MGKLLEAYDTMHKQAEVEVQKTAEFEYLEKIAASAEFMLKEEYGDDGYTAEMVEKVAAALIEQNIVAQQEEEKIASFEDQGRIMARGFLQELKEQGQ